MIIKDLPEEQRIFTMAHELKHHLKDQNLKIIHCGSTNENEVIEIGAEVFAAELIFPERDFKSCMTRKGIAPFKCTPKNLVELKRETQTTLSYAGLSKRAQWLEFALNNAFVVVKWKKLEEEIYGEPLIKRYFAIEKEKSDMLDPGFICFKITTFRI